MTFGYIRTALDGRRVKLRTTDDTFHEGLEEFKFFIPIHLRQYDPATKEWIVDFYAEKELSRWVRHVERSGGRVTYDDGPDPEPRRKRTYRKPQTEPRQLSPYHKLCLTPDAPIELVRAAKRALAILYHPDKPTGNLEKMQAINDAADRIEKGQAA